MPPQELSRLLHSPTGSTPAVVQQHEFIASRRPRPRARQTFGELRAVDGIDLDVPRGMIFAILGPNGAGKTTLMRMLATLLHPDEGTASVMGHDLATAPDKVRGEIAMTGQFASLDEDLTGRENLMLLARLWGFRGGAARERADELLATFDLADAATKQVKDYSGGMRRRLDIAASLIVTPGVLFLDEPTTGLDPVARKSVWRMIRQLAGSGVTILLTTQYMDEADQLAARIAVIDHGKKIAEGTPRELKVATGSGFLHVALADPARLDEAATLLEAQLGASVQRSVEGAHAGGGREDAAGRERGAGRADRRRHRARGLLDGQPESRRSVLRADRKGQTMNGLTQVARPPAPSALSNALVFGWRAVLKFKHVPEQLFDLVMTPIMFTLLFTFVFGGALAGSPRRLSTDLPARHPRADGGVQLGVFGHGPVDRPRQRAVRPVPLAAHLVAGAVRGTHGGRRAAACDRRRHHPHASA